MLLLFIRTATVAHVAVLGRVPGIPGAYVTLDRHPDAEPIAGVLVLRLESPLFYANAAPVRDRVKKLVGHARPSPSAVILDVGAAERLDLTSAEVMDELVGTLRSAGIDVGLTEVRQPLIEIAAKTGLLRTVGQDRVFHTIDEAVEAMAAANPACA
jgi:SulP family sulfate permease